jgi:serine/threonine protein kinase
VDEKADVRSFGLMLYQLLSGQLPFRADNAAERFALHRDQPLPPE